MFEVTALYYDKYGRVVQTRSTNHLGGYDITYNALDFLGKPTKTLKTHNIAGQASVVELYTYDYDKAQRPTTTTYSLNGGGAVTLVSNTYDDLGRLMAKRRHANADTETYAYNVRSWPTSINSGGFTENLYYNTNLPSGASANYNGNIAYSTWTYNGATKGYLYDYDGLNRLLSSSFKQGSSGLGDDSFNEAFTYDKMGNILTLKRKKNYTQIDDLVFHYSNNEKSNQLQYVDDGGATQSQYLIKEYQNKSTAQAEFEYDANGNMKKDLDRDIATIRYNVLNLPDVVQFKNGNQIKNTYNAGGQKLGTEYFTWLPGANAPVVNIGDVLNISYSQGAIDQNGTVYIGNVEYNTKNGNSSLTAISRIHNMEGYVENISSPNYYYYRKDHLGNNREVWLANTNTTKQWTQYYPSGLPWVTTSNDNLSTQPYKYNGKEFVEMHGLDVTDLGNRGLHNAKGRFDTMDRFAEKYPWQSPYCFAANNPINYIDVNGDSIWVSYNDANGQQQRMLYTQGMKYSGNDSFISTVVTSLNEMASVDIGKTVLDQLSGSQSNYNFTNTFATDKNGNVVKNALAFDGKTGEISAGVLINNPTMLKSQKIESTGHELFHAYQSEFGETGATINREIGAYAFGRALVTNLGYGALGYGNSSPSGQIYENAMSTFVFSPSFNQQAYNTAINNFQKGATVNSNSAYNRFIVRSNDLKPVIKNFFPLVK